jgi:formylglycine-generating enzyme required for sulfatase activity
MDPHFRWTRKWGAAQNAPLLEGIAWYGGNCGVDYELPEGLDMSAWPEKHYEFKMAGTHPVGRKTPNAWGLYDMLGNVWEWCLNQYDYEYASEAADREPAEQVIRGGAWDALARSVRAAFQSGLVPVARRLNLGLRCGEFRAGELSEE